MTCNYYGIQTFFVFRRYINIHYIHIMFNTSTWVLIIVTARTPIYSFSYYMTGIIM